MNAQRRSFGFAAWIPLITFIDVLLARSLFGSWAAFPAVIALAMCVLLLPVYRKGAGQGTARVFAIDYFLLVFACGLSACAAFASPEVLFRLTHGWTDLVSMVQLLTPVGAVIGLAFAAALYARTHRDVSPIRNMLYVAFCCVLSYWATSALIHDHPAFSGLATILTLLCLLGFVVEHYFAKGKFEWSLLGSGRVFQA